MKKSIAAVFILITVFALVAGCANNNQQGASPSPTGPESPQGQESIAASPVTGVRTGFGCDISIAKSASASTDEQGNVVNALAQSDIIMASVTLDEQGTILGVQFDSAQTKINFDNKGNIVTDIGIEQQTKKELRDQYGMKQASGIGKEWYEQAEALEDWMRGKNIDTVLNMKTSQGGDKEGVPEEADLTSSVTISVTGYLRALQKAADNAGDAATPTGVTKTGLGTFVSIARSKSVSVEDGKSADAVGEAYVTMVAVTVDADGRILDVIIDQAQPKASFNAQGVLTTDLTAEIKTKKELGDAYGMKQASGIGKEWYEQAAALEDWIKGKTIDEVMAMKTAEGGDHAGAPEEADLTSSVTIVVTDILATVREAVANAS